MSKTRIINKEERVDHLKLKALLFLYQDTTKKPDGLNIYTDITDEKETNEKIFPIKAFEGFLNSLQEEGLIKRHFPTKGIASYQLTDAGKDFCETLSEALKGNSLVLAGPMDGMKAAVLPVLYQHTQQKGKGPRPGKLFRAIKKTLNIPRAKNVSEHVSEETKRLSCFTQHLTMLENHGYITFPGLWKKLTLTNKGTIFCAALKEGGKNVIPPMDATVAETPSPPHSDSDDIIEISGYRTSDQPKPNIQARVLQVFAKHGSAQILTGREILAEISQQDAQKPATGLRRIFNAVKKLPPVKVLVSIWRQQTVDMALNKLFDKGNITNLDDRNDPTTPETRWQALPHAIRDIGLD